MITVTGYFTNIDAFAYEHVIVGEHRFEIVHAVSLAIIDIDHDALASGQYVISQNVFFPVVGADI